MADPPVVLSIAGYDPSSGAGITADIKTAAALGCYAATCITALTVQSTQGVFAVRPLAPELVSQTLAALADDFDIAAVRLGMLGSGEVAAAVAGFLDSRRLPNVVLDPVIRSSSGAALLDEAGLEFLRGAAASAVRRHDAQYRRSGDAGGSRARFAAGTVGRTALPGLRRWRRSSIELGAKGVVITGGHLGRPMTTLVLKDEEERRRRSFRVSGWSRGRRTALAAPSPRRWSAGWRWVTNFPICPRQPKSMFEVQSSSAIPWVKDRVNESFGVR